MSWPEKGKSYGVGYFAVLVQQRMLERDSRHDIFWVVFFGFMRLRIYYKVV